MSVIAADNVPKNIVAAVRSNEQGTGSIGLTNISENQFGGIAYYSARVGPSGATEEETFLIYFTINSGGSGYKRVSKYETDRDDCQTGNGVKPLSQRRNLSTAPRDHSWMATLNDNWVPNFPFH